MRSDLVIPSLQKVKMWSFADDDLDYLVRNCPSLRTLDLDTRGNAVTGPYLRLLTNLHQSLGELSLSMSNVYTAQPDKQLAEALVDIVRQCSNLKKVSLSGDSLQAAKFTELCPFGHLFYELEFPPIHRKRFQQPTEVVSNFLRECVNLRKLHFTSGRNNDALLVALKSCLLLEELDLSSFSFDTQKGELLGADLFRLINRHCKHFCKLRLESSGVSESTLRHISGIEALQELVVDECEGEGMAGAGMAVLATMGLAKLSIHSWTEAPVLPFVGSNISQTLESFILKIYRDELSPIGADRITSSLASCPNLKSISIYFGDGCVFGDNGLAGLQAMAAGCPLLADVSFSSAAPGLHYIATHWTNLKKCSVLSGVSTDLRQELLTLYPHIEWILPTLDDDDSLSDG